MAGLSGLQIVGKVGVKVIPYTKEFRPEAQRELDKRKNRLEAKVHVTFSEAEMKRGALEAVRDLNRALRTNDAYRVKFRMTIATTSMREEIRKALRKLDGLASTERVKFTAELTGNVVLDRDSLDKVKRDLHDWQRDNSPLQIDVKPQLVEGTSSVVSTRLRVLTRPREVAIIPRVSKTAAARAGATLAALAGARVLSDTLESLWNNLKKLDKSVPIIGTIAEAIAGLSAYAAAGASNLFALSQSLAQIGPAALALPGILGGMTIGVAAFAVAMKDFNKHFPAFSISASKTTKAGKAWKQLQDIMSNNFWDKAVQPVRELIETLFPQFASGMARVSSELGGFTAKLATSLKNVFNGALASMFRDLGDSIAVMSGYTDAFANIIKNLGAVGAGYLPKLAGWFGDLLTRFDTFISEASADGRLKGWIENGVTQIKELGRAVGNLGGIFNGLADIAERAGGSTLTMFADTLQRVETVVKGKTFSTILEDVLRAAHAAMGDIADKSGPAFTRLMTKLGRLLPSVFESMGDTIGTALDAIADALARPAIRQGILALFDGLNLAVKSLAPAMAPLADAIGAILEVAGVLAENIGLVLAPVLEALSGVVVTLAGPIKTLATILGDALASAVETLAPVITTLAEGLAVVLNATLPALADLLNQLAPVLTQMANAIVEALPPLMDALAEALPALVEAITPALIEMLKALIPLLPAMIENLTQLIIALTPVLPQLGQVLLIAAKTLPIIVSSTGGLIDVTRTLTTGLATALTSFSKWFQGWSDMISGFANGDWKMALGGLRNVWDGFLSGLWNSVKTAFVPITLAFTAFGDQGEQILKGIGRQLINGLINGLTLGTIGPLRDTLGYVTDFIKEHKGPISKDRKLLTPAGQVIIDGLIRGLESRTGALRKSLRGITNTIEGTQIGAPRLAGIDVPDMSSRLAATINPAISTEGQVVRQFVYNAAPDRSLSSEEDLFAAAESSRMVDW